MFLELLLNDLSSRSVKDCANRNHSASYTSRMTGQISQGALMPFLLISVVGGRQKPRGQSRFRRAGRQSDTATIHILTTCEAIGTRHPVI